MRAVVVGGGISGLAAAFELQKGGAEVTVVESRARAGGILQTDHVDSCTIECGADSFLSSKPAALELIREIGLEHDVIPCNEAKRRTLLLRRGTLHALPAGLQMMVPTRVGPVLRSPLLSWNTKLRMLRERFYRPVDRADRSVAEFVSDHFGDEAVSLLAEPLLSGVYGGSAQTLGVQSVMPKFAAMEKEYGSITRGVQREGAGRSGPLFLSLRGGMGQLTEALAARLSVMHGEVQAIETGRVRVDGDWIPADRIILACGAPASARLLQHTEAGALLASIQHSSAAIVAMVFARDEVRHPLDGFGFLVPATERRNIMACTWVSTKFPDRAPQDKVLLRCFLGGNRSESDAALVALCREDLAGIMGIPAGAAALARLSLARFARAVRCGPS